MKKIISLLLSLMIFIGFGISSSYASTDEQSDKKVIYVSLNRSNLEDFESIPILKEKIKSNGNIALMTIKGDKSNTDEKSFASIGAGCRANVLDENYTKFETLSEDEKVTFKSITGVEPLEINDLMFNKNFNQNLEKGSYGAVLGRLGQTLQDNDLKVSLIGNSDMPKSSKDIFNPKSTMTKIRLLGLTAMDEHGRIPFGNTDDINKKDNTMPYGISTDYDKLKSETEKFYNSTDVTFVELGDTYRLDKYKSFLNEETYEITKGKIYENINNYLTSVFNMVDENDIVYIVSEYPSQSDYSDKKRLCPVVKISNDSSAGLLESATTRQEGIVSNIDIGVDILNEFSIKDNVMIGKHFKDVEEENNVGILLNKFERIVSINSIRASVVNSFVGIVSFSWIIGTLALLFKDRIPKSKGFINREKIFKILKEFIKLGLIMPLAFLSSPLFGFKTEFALVSGVVILTIIYYIISKLLFKGNDLKQMGFYTLLTIGLIVIDCVLGTPLMQRGIMSYDAIYGARYYGVGNEYEGVTIASAIFGLAVLLHYKKISKWLAVLISGVIFVTSAMPSMGANVGGAISECVAYLVFILLLFDIKLDLKKIIMIGLSVVGVLVAFIALDLLMGTESHLSVFTNQILQEGPSAIFNTFGRKIGMNIKLAKSSVWVNILIVSIIIIGAFIFRPSKHFKKINTKYPVIFKGFMASFVGCIVTLLVNDSGIVAASTAAIYILIPIIIISINMIIFDENKE